MFVTKVNLLVLVFCCFFFQSRGLQRLALGKDNTILVTESTIRNITSKLFKELNLKSVNFNSKLRRYILVHNFLTSDTLKDHKALNKIIGLSRVDNNNGNNETEVLVTVLNEILNEDGTNSHDSSIHNEDVIEYIAKFLTNLDAFKENNGIVNADYDSLEIKDEIIQILRSDNTNEFNVSQNNVTEAKTSQEDSFVSDIEFWVPEKLETRRIYHGTKTKILYFPFMVSVLIFNNFQCGGSLVKSDLVITAASCVQLAWNNRFFRENPSFLAIRVGSTFYNGGGEKVPIMEVYFYPSYNPKNLEHNIVVLRLLRTLKIRKNKPKVKKIEIDRHDSPLPMNTDGITIVGWGAKRESNLVGSAWSNQLSHAVLDVYHLHECQKVYSREYVRRTNFCAGFISKGGGACNHDVGGPGIVNGLLTGVISFGSPVCGSPDAPTVFTKVGYYADWIDEIMEQAVPIIRKSTTLRPPPFVFTLPPKHLMTTGEDFLPLVTKQGPFENIKPMPIQNSDNTLRILENGDLFKEFLSTMFKSKEIDEYKDLINNNPEAVNYLIQPIQTKERKASKIPTQNIKRVSKPLKKLKPKVKIIPKAPKIPEQNFAQYNTESVDMEEIEDTQKTIRESAFVTKMDIKDTIQDMTDEIENYETEITTKKQKASKKYTMLDKNLIIDANHENDDKRDSLENDIVKLIDNIDVSVSLTSQENLSGSKISLESLNDRIEASKKLKSVQVTETPIQENVLTLLYLTDNEKNIGNFGKTDNDNEDFDDDDISEGMDISTGGFNDLTIRTNESASVLDLRSKNELYDLLAEAVNEMTEETMNK